MKLTELTAISPVDGRYRSKVSGLSTYFSEFALIKYRVHVEIEYFIALVRIRLPQLQEVEEDMFTELRDIYETFTLIDAAEIKKLEKVTNHDVKAVEYFLKKRFTDIGLGKYIEFIHFGLTSQDINNTAIPLSLKQAHSIEFNHHYDKLIEVLSSLSEQWKEVPMLARTHGQPASPTRVGKEIMVFIDRLKVQYRQFSLDLFTAKFGGATGNFNAHHVAFPTINWKSFANQFVEGNLELKRSAITTQIDHYDQLAALFDLYQRINTILIDCCRDIWTYISMDYFKQKINKDEVGSSAMPHKVNPIDFENAEGNFGIANALYNHMARKLPISRLQRDLTDSTVLRNIGVPFSHTIIAMQSMIKGLNKLRINENAILKDLEHNWLITSEAIQTILRREHYPQPYEKLKELTRNHSVVDRDVMHNFIDSLDVKDDVKKELKEITPMNYTGIPN